MAFSAISYRLRPGVATEVTELLGGAVTAGDGAGPIKQAGAYVQDDVLVRSFEHEGVTEDVLAELVSTPERLATELRLAALAEAPELSGDRAALLDLLRESTMQQLQQRSIGQNPDTRMAALRYLVKPGHADEIAAVFADVQAEARPTLRTEGGQEVGLILAVALFVREDSMVRVVQYTGEISDVAQYMAKRGGRPDMERRLAPFMAEHRTVETREDFLAQFARNTMTPIALQAPATSIAR